MTEALGFITGAVCVYLTLRENVWNFPIGLANNLFFLFLFLQGRLFGDAALQIIYLVLGIQGWYQWLFGGVNKTSLKVSSFSRRGMLFVFAFVLLATPCLTIALRRFGDASPGLDAATTVLSLAAQYLLNWKAIENWLLWLLADVIYVHLYLSRGLRLTAVLYFGFACLCLAGFRAWRGGLRGGGETAAA
jgi:nicotinamide mononucleotide transporter